MNDSGKTKEQWLIEGFMHYNGGRYKEAIVLYDYVLNLDPKFTFAYICRGDAYLALKEYGRAIDDYDQVIEIDPMFADAYNNRGIAYRHLHEYEKALADHDRAISITPADAIPYYSRGLEDVCMQYLGCYRRQQTLDQFR